jgi:uncharacterized coiled-coil protein SlyX
MTLSASEPKSNVVQLGIPRAGTGSTGGPYDPGMEARIAKLESDVGHIRSEISEIKNVLTRLAPRIDEMYGKLPFFSTKEDIANLKIEVGKRPTRRQSILDIFSIVALIGALLAIGARLAH